MKTIAAVAIVAAGAMLGVGTGHADQPQDVFKMDKYEAEVKQGGVVYDSENQVIVQGLIDCNGVAEHGSRQAWLSSFKDSRLMNMHDLTVETDAAIDVFCPQFKGRP